MFSDKHPLSCASFGYFPALPPGLVSIFLKKSKRNKAGWKSWQVAKAVAQNRILVSERDGLTLDWPSFYLPMFQKWGVTCVVCHLNIATHNIAKTSCIKNY